MTPMLPVVLVATLLIGGCATSRPPAAPAPIYHDQREFSSVAVAWNIERSAADVRVTGIVRNVNYQRLRDLVLTVTARNVAGAPVGDGAFLFPSPVLDIGTAWQFDLTVPVVSGAIPSSLQFVLRYRPADGELSERLTGQSFDAPLP